MRPLLEATNLEKTYGRQIVLGKVSFVIQEGAHIGLVGRNGAGKTTLLKILSGDEEADAGEVKLMPWTRLGLIRQHDVLPEDATTISYLESYSEKPEWTCAKLASRFGLHKEELAKAPSELSGGYQMRVKIVAMLLQDPNLLLLDEPMNYLDLPTLLLLESFLKDYPGTFMMTSHDRETMQNVCTSTWEIERGELFAFPGDIETYLDWKDEQAEYARRSNKRVRKQMAHAQEFVDRFRYKASQASRAQSKIKHIAKLRTRLRDLGDDLPTAAFKIRCPNPTSGTVLRCEDLTVGYGDVPIVGGITYEVPRGAKVAIVGENGHGKTTFLKTLAGALPLISGQMKWWHRANIGYFSQLSEEALNPDATVLQTLMQAAPSEASGERVLAAAGAFLFRNDDLEKPCRVLSGGERARVRLARLVLQEHNVLILDEPTNHLDAETVEVLAAALKTYPGTVFLVSHARTFMNAIVDDIYEVHGGRGRHYPGTYEEYVADLVSIADESIHEEDGQKNAKALQAQERREQNLRRKHIQRSQQKIDARMQELDTERSTILAFFFENPTDYAPDKATRLAEIDEEVARLEREWLKLEEELGNRI